MHLIREVRQKAYWYVRNPNTSKLSRIAEFSYSVTKFLIIQIMDSQNTLDTNCETKRLLEYYTAAIIIVA